MRLLELEAKRIQELGEELRRARLEGGAFRVPPRLQLRLAGADAFRYLNGQVTSDLGRLEDGAAQPACLLTPKGKLCATLLIRRDRDDLLIEADPSREEALTARLERYIVADDVTLTLEPSPPLLHLFGQALLKEPWASAPGIRVPRLGEIGLDIAPETPGTGSLALLDPLVIEALRIERCLPAWGFELGEETLPPEAGLDRTHIDYDRGCYPGQEVISRLKSVGRVNRLLRLLTAHGDPGPSTLEPGMTLVTGECKEVGSITSVSPRFDTGSATALGYLGRGVLEATEPLFALDPLTGEKTPISISDTSGS